MGDPSALMDRLTAAQNAHDLEGMLSCFHENYRSEQPQFPARTFQGIDQVRANWSALLDAIPDFHSEVVRSAVDRDVVFAEVHWTGTKADGTPLEERGVICWESSMTASPGGASTSTKSSERAKTSMPSSVAWPVPRTDSSHQPLARSMRDAT